MKTSRTTDLNNVRYLLETVDGGSFSAAARVLGVAPSLVSRKIARLEKEVGARLFQRTTRSLRLTDAGHGFLGHARDAMQSFALAQELLGAADGVLSGRVRISAPAGAASVMWATITRFLRHHPGVRLELEVADRYVDLVEERFDLAIRSAAESRPDNLIRRRLLAAPRWLVANPDYLRRHGTPRAVKDLKDCECVVLGARAERNSWHIQAAGRGHKVFIQGRIAVNDASIAAACAADGFGIAFLPVAVCAKYLDTGRLVRILPRVSAGDTALWIVYPDRHLPAVSRALVEFLLKELPLDLKSTAGRRAARAAEASIGSPDIAANAQ